ncbi:uncharacterized protein BN793_00751 [Firmicutes bacterium CAG:822]|nr:uncharacterized protein BN793_00751 [Firmicutes bacterium CAG:822]
MEKNREFSSVCTFDYKKYKEFALGAVSTRKMNILFMFVSLLLLILYMIMGSYGLVIIIGIICGIFLIIYKVAGINKIQYKRTKNLNNGEDLRQTFKVSCGNIVLTSQKGDTSSYKLSQIISIIETENLFILKLKYNVGIIVDKNNLTGGSKEEFINYLFENCENLKSKKVINSKKWVIIRRVFLGICLLIFLLAIIFSFMNSNRMDKYEKSFEDKDYNVDVNESVNDGYTFKTMTVMSNNSVLYVYDFKTDKMAEHNLEYWAKSETDDNVKDEYIKEDSKDYKKYIIDDKGYVILIRKDNFVFYGIGNSHYKDELNDMIEVIDN